MERRVVLVETLNVWHIRFGHLNGFHIYAITNQIFFCRFDKVDYFVLSLPKILSMEAVHLKLHKHRCSTVKFLEVEYDDYYYIQLEAVHSDCTSDFMWNLGMQVHADFF